MRKNNKGQRILKQKGSNYKCREPFPNEEDLNIGTIVWDNAPGYQLLFSILGQKKKKILVINRPSNTRHCHSNCKRSIAMWIFFWGGAFSCNPHNCNKSLKLWKIWSSPFELPLASKELELLLNVSHPIPPKSLSPPWQIISVIFFIPITSN